MIWFNVLDLLEKEDKPLCLSEIYFIYIEKYGEVSYYNLSRVLGKLTKRTHICAVRMQMRDENKPISVLHYTFVYK